MQFGLLILYCKFTNICLHLSLIIYSHRHPVIYHNIYAGQNINHKAIFYYLLPVLVVSIAATFPRFFEAEIDIVQHMKNYTDPITGQNVSHVSTVHKLEYSSLRFHDSYVLWYLNIFRLLFFGLGPFALLVYFNYHIHQV